MTKRQPTRNLPPITAGDRHGRLTAVRFSERRKGRNIWEFRCDCGGVQFSDPKTVRSGGTRSCGCIRRETPQRRTHGQSKTRIYRLWFGMLERCRNPKNPNFRYYGERGIIVCEAWQSFETFAADMGQAPDRYTLERKDNSRGYEPNNCKWATRKEQARNTRRNVIIKYQGRMMTVSEACELSGIKVPTVFNRIALGWAESDLFLPRQTKWSRRP